MLILLLYLLILNQSSLNLTPPLVIDLLPPLYLLLEPLSLLDECEGVLVSPLSSQVPLLGTLLGGLEERPAIGCADAQAKEGKA